MTQQIAYIHEAPDGSWHCTDDCLGYLDERGLGMPSRAAARRKAAHLGYTHVRGSHGLGSGDTRRIPATDLRPSPPMTV